MIITSNGWSLEFSWTPNIIGPIATNDNELSNVNVEVDRGSGSEEVLQWINFSVKQQDQDEDETNQHRCAGVLQLHPTDNDNESCTLTITRLAATNNESAKFKTIKIVSKARRIEFSSKRQGYLGTETGQRVVDDYYHVELCDVKARDLILKFVSFSNKEYLELTNLQIQLEETNLNGAYRVPGLDGAHRVPGSQIAGPKIDMDAVHAMLQEIDQPLSENAQMFMNKVLLLKQKQPSVNATEVDISAMMAMMASVAPDRTSQHAAGSDVTSGRRTGLDNARLEEKVGNIVDAKMERLEAKMMQKLDISVSAMEGRLTGKLDLLLAALDSGQSDQT